MYEYRITVQADGAGEKILEEIEELLKRPIEDLLGTAGEPLPRLSLDWHLFNPLLLQGEPDWQAHVSVSPRHLSQAKRSLFRTCATSGIRTAKLQSTKT